MTFRIHVGKQSRCVSFYSLWALFEDSRGEKIGNVIFQISVTWNFVYWFKGEWNNPFDEILACSKIRTILQNRILKKIEFPSFNWTIKVAVKRTPWSNRNVTIGPEKIQRSNHWPWFKNIILLRPKSYIMTTERRRAGSSEAISLASFFRQSFQSTKREMDDDKSLH